jgi:hypothetical protein
LHPFQLSIHLPFLLALQHAYQHPPPDESVQVKCQMLPAVFHFTHIIHYYDLASPTDTYFIPFKFHFSSPPPSSHLITPADAQPARVPSSGHRLEFPPIHPIPRSLLRSIVLRTCTLRRAEQTSLRLTASLVLPQGRAALRPNQVPQEDCQRPVGVCRASAQLLPDLASRRMHM